MLINELEPEQIRELQTALTLAGYPVGEMDGVIGPRTRNAWAEFKTDVFQGNSSLIGPESIEILRKLVEETANFSAWSPAGKEDTINGIIDECQVQGMQLLPQVAYVLATTQWETAQTFRPVREAFWKKNAEEWRKKNLPYYPYYGRGYVQLTWKNNYEKYGAILGVDLVNNLDLALEPGIARFVLVHGFRTGSFTGRKISDYINDSGVDFIRARRCINGADKAREIAELAQNFMGKLA
jgi:hypothetical protein